MTASAGTIAQLFRGPDREAHVAMARRRLEGKEPEKIIDWAIGVFGARLGFTTALGYGGVVLLEMLRRRLPLVEAFFIDTRHHFDETLDLMFRLEEWGCEQSGGEIRFTVLRPAESEDRIVQLAGSPAWQTDPDLCCKLRKVDPMDRVIGTRDAWMSALRRDQGPTRSGVDVLRIDERGVVRVHPLAGWTSEQCWAFIREYELPYNPLHDCGYPSVGCVHCTVPVVRGEPERAGRWASRTKTECGLHSRRLG